MIGTEPEEVFVRTRPGAAGSIRRLVVGVALVASAAAVSIDSLGSLTRDANSFQLRLTEITALANRHSSLEWHAVRSLTDELSVAIAANDRELEASTRQLAGAAAGDQEVAQFVELVSRYRTAARSMLDLLGAGDIEAAERTDEEIVDPLFDAVHASAEALRIAYRGRADLTSSVSRVGTLVMLGVAAVAVAGYAARSTRREAEGRIEARYRALVQNSSDLVTVIEPGGRIVYVGASVERLLGRASEATLGLSYAALVRPDDAERYEALIADARAQGPTGTSSAVIGMVLGDGTERQFKTLARDLETDPDVGGLVLTARDATERERLSERLRFKATHDDLTGLANRKTFLDAVAVSLDQSESVAVMFIDIDDFKAINDNLGHSAADRALANVAERIRGAIRPTDLAARLGGDEFGILVTGVRPDHDIRVIAERLLAAIGEPIEIRSGSFRLSASIGVALGRVGTKSEDLVSEADLAMYSAKRGGKGRVAFFEPGLQASSRDRLELQQELSEALKRDQLVVHYQPIVQLATNHIASFEALLRWSHPRRGLVPPDTFIPLAEETGLIVEIGDWVIREALTSGATWRAAAGRDLGISVNVSPVQLADAAFADRVTAMLSDARVPADALTLEITENVLADPSPALSMNLSRLRGAGVTIVIDDFGTGFSALSYLRRLTIDAIKIDRSFVSPIDGGGVDQSLCAAVLHVASALGLGTVAEGVETLDQLDQLRRLGCEAAQGYVLSRPLPAAAVDAALSAGTLEALIAAPLPARPAKRLTRIA